MSVSLPVQSAAASGDEPISDEVIVQFLPSGSVDVFNAAYGTSTLDRIEGRPIYLLQLPASMTRDQFELLVLGDPTLDWHELNVTASDPGGDTRSFYGSMAVGSYTQQVGQHRLHLAPAHAITTGAGVRVAVLDTGLNADHPVLAVGILPGWNFVTDSADTADIARGTDSDGDGAVDEFVGHGTMVAGMVRLVAPHAEILPIVVLDSDGRSTSWRVAEGIYHAIDARVDVINLSLGTAFDTRVLLDAVDEARQHWIPVVAAAGNNGPATPPRFPAAMQDNRTIAVTATDWTGALPAFSSLGDHVTVAAPGVDVVGPFTDGGYQVAEGTSFSTAWVTGAVALLKSRGWDTSPGNLSRLIERSAVDIDAVNPGMEGLFGGGMLDIGQALLDHLAEPGCPADMNDDDLLTADDFTAWIDAYNTGDFSADQNRDRRITPDDFTAWIRNFNRGC
ncbi:MAG: S8 family peptidase [Phycisphaerales bacterium]